MLAPPNITETAIDNTKLSLFSPDEGDYYHARVLIPLKARMAKLGYL